MELGKSFTYIFQDKRWLTKVLVGWLVSLVPILNFAFTGFVTQTIRNVEQKLEDPMPEWDDFGKKFMLGFYMWVAGVVYALPLILLSLIFVIPAAVAGDSNSDVVTSLFAGTAVVFSCLAFIYGLALTLFMPAMNINLARKETFGSVFEVGQFLKIFRANTGDYLIAWIMTIVWSIVISLVLGVIIVLLSWTICIPWVLAGMIGVIIPLVYAHLFGQVAARELNAA